MSDLPRLCIVTASPLTVQAFLPDQIRTLSRSHHVTLVSAFAPHEVEELARDGIRAVRIPIERRIAPLRDLVAAWFLFRLFRSERFDAVHSVTPKAGLLAMTVARAARVPVRVHVFTGQVWATRTGAARRGLKAVDRFFARNATTVLVDSASQREFLMEERVLAGVDARVLADGSISGVDTGRFRPNPEARFEVREELGIPVDAAMILYVGRLNHDKGVLDLASAFDALASRGAPYLVFVGPDESGLRPVIEARSRDSEARLRFVGASQAPERYMAAADVLALPSYREGFGTVVIEAAACGVPAVASRIYGLTDAVDEGVTGLLHPPGDAAAIADALASVLADREGALAMGRAARERVARQFSQRRLSEAVAALHAELRADAASRNRAGMGTMVAGLLRRSFDVVVSATSLMVLTPVLAWIALRVHRDLGSPVLFTQRRAGQFGRPFSIVKFRTMRDDRDADGRPLEDGARLTPFGRWLRSTSLDELPELWNVLKGDMSLIGPRPLPVEYLERYTPEQARRHEVRPGVTGWAQVNGRNALGWSDRFALDVWYVDNRTAALDLRILLMTVRQVLAREGVSAPGHATMAPFTGREES